MIQLLPFTVHEAQVAVFHAWNDGRPVQGPLPRHLKLGIIARFRSGLSLARQDDGELAPGFGDWRPGRTLDGQWLVETSAPLVALNDEGAPVESIPAPGTPVVVMVRFLHRESKQWRLWQFHDCELLPATAAENSQKMMTSWKFRAGHCEQFSGALATMPDLSAPILRGTIEWIHRGRTLRCFDYDAASNSWAENPENRIDVAGDTARYVTIEDEGGDITFGYLTPVTGVAEGGAAGIDVGTLHWMNALAFTVTASSGLTPDDGWTLETEGCAEPILLPESGLHWDHPQVVFRFLGRRYATVSHGFIALPSLADGPPDEPTIDYPIRLGRLLLLPDQARILPAS